MVCVHVCVCCTPDGQFPIDLSVFQVEKDHSFLEQADIESLKRRLNTLNRCTHKMDEMRVRVSHMI